MNRFNDKGYYDPTPYEAITNIEREEKAFLPLAYVASPFSGDVEKNIEQAIKYCRFVSAAGFIPVAPHLLFPRFLNDNDSVERELGLRYALVLLGKCHELWVFGDTISEGISREIARAKKRGMPIKYFNCNCEEVLS